MLLNARESNECRYGSDGMVEAEGGTMDERRARQDAQRKPGLIVWSIGEDQSRHFCRLPRRLRIETADLLLFIGGHEVMTRLVVVDYASCLAKNTPW